MATSDPPSGFGWRELADAGARHGETLKAHLAALSDIHLKTLFPDLKPDLARQIATDRHAFAHVVAMARDIGLPEPPLAIFSAGKADQKTIEQGSHVLAGCLDLAQLGHSLTLVDRKRLSKIYGEEFLTKAWSHFDQLIEPICHFREAGFQIDPGKLPDLVEPATSEAALVMAIWSGTIDLQLSDLLRHFGLVLEVLRPQIGPAAASRRAMA